MTTPRFLLSGIPNLVANQDAAPYLPDYHAESDVLDAVDGSWITEQRGISRQLSAVFTVINTGVKITPMRFGQDLEGGL